VFSERGPLNYSGYRSGKFDKLAARVASETNPKKRRRAVLAELELLDKDAPVVPLLFQEGAYVYRPQVYDGWAFSPSTGILNKQSFLRSTAKSARGSGSGAILPAGSEGAGGGGIGVLGFVALGLVGVVLVILTLGLGARLLARR
jgi:hypothetical protein